METGRKTGPVAKPAVSSQARRAVTGIATVRDDDQLGLGADLVGLAPQIRLVQRLFGCFYAVGGRVVMPGSIPDIST